jgi:hypothetical protein
MVRHCIARVLGSVLLSTLRPVHITRARATAYTHYE